MKVRNDFFWQEHGVEMAFSSNGHVVSGRIASVRVHDIYLLTRYFFGGKKHARPQNPIHKPKNSHHYLGGFWQFASASQKVSTWEYHLCTPEFMKMMWMATWQT